MWEDPIVAEVRRTREKILAEFNYDIDAYAAHIMAIQDKKKKHGFKYASPPGRTPRADVRSSPDSTRFGNDPR
jgi:hypothetical protein